MSAPRRLRVTISYDGTEYCGFQRQGRGLVSVQDVLYEAIAAVTGGPPERFAAAGRTDAGVHARGQVIAFDTSGKVPAERIPAALNANLPQDVAAVAAAEVTERFHPRFDATGKTYAYSFYGQDGAPREPLLGRYCLYVPRQLDVAAMATAAAQLRGRHDCSALQDTGRPVKDAVRWIESCTVEIGAHQQAPWTGLPVVTISVTAQGFLYHMVRIIAGTLVEVGRGRQEPGLIARLLAEGRRSLAGPTLPARGLCLMQVHYDQGFSWSDKGQSPVDTPRSVS